MRKPGRPKTTGKGEMIGVRCHPPLLAQLDAWCKQQPIPPSRAAAIRHLTEKALRSERPRSKPAG